MTNTKHYINFPNMKNIILRITPKKFPSSTTTHNKSGKA